MFVGLEEIGHYEEFLRSNGMEILRREALRPDLGSVPGNHRRPNFLGVSDETGQRFSALSESLPGHARGILFRSFCLRLAGGQKTRPGYSS